MVPIFKNGRNLALLGKYLRNRQKQPAVELVKKGVLRNFAKFTRKYLCQGLFYNKVAGLRPGKE